MPQERNQQPTEANAPERRFFHIQARAQSADDGKMVVGGYGAIFNSYTNMGWYAEVIEPGFFDDIKQDRCACLFNHDPNQVLGRTKNGTLKLKLDDTGLDYESVLPSHRADVHELVKDGYIYESSFAFTTKEARWEDVDRDVLEGVMSKEDLDQLSWQGKITIRRLMRGRELFDVSPVTYGAYEGTTTDTRVAKRSYDMWREAHPPEEKREQTPQEVPDNSDAAEWESYMQAAREYLAV